MLRCYRFRATERKRSCNAGYRSVQRSVPFKRKKLFRRLIERCDRFACEVPSSRARFVYSLKTIFSSLSSVTRCVVCRSPSALLRSLAISFPRIARYLLRVSRYLLPSGRSLSPSLGSLAISFESLAISFLRISRYLVRSGHSLIVVSFVWFAVLFRSTSPFFTVSFLPCFGILCVSLAIFSHLQNAR